MGAPWRSWCRRIVRAGAAFPISRASAGRCRSSTRRCPRRSQRNARIAFRRGARARLREQRAAYRLALPGPLYCDTSALLKLYLPEPGSDAFNRMVEGRDDLLVSDLAVTEVVSALARRLRQDAITRETARRVQHAIAGRLDGGAYGRIELTRDVHRRAEHFLLSLTKIQLRAADALHLALATSARAASVASFDVRLGAAARAIGLAVHPV
ncbi:MAG: hypothetical protein DMD96_17135 [Candidatus Rokuibacteriota bacterium]|nr:MAG: hypothetical protein DMD96_17135 [Candidatus Rokubacteria bacterium]